MLKERMIYGAIGVCGLALVLYIGGWLFNVAVLVFVLIGMHEIYSAFQKKGHRPVQWAGYTAVAIFYAQHLYFSMIARHVNASIHGGPYDFLFLLAAILVFLAMPVFARDVKPIDSALTIMGFVYPGLTFIFALLLKHQTMPGNYLLIITLFATFSTDTFAYFTGRLLGHSKLCPEISPNKTVEGAVGGVLGSMVVTSIVGLVLNTIYKVDVGLYHFVVIGLLCGVLSQIGDLSASAVKRYCGIKDFGRMLPGHGGIMDRCDSLLFTMPVCYMYYMVFLA